jgi:hypothetical protein
MKNARLKSASEFNVMGWRINCDKRSTNTIDDPQAR